MGKAKRAHQFHDAGPWQSLEDGRSSHVQLGTELNSVPKTLRLAKMTAK